MRTLRRTRTALLLSAFALTLALFGAPTPRGASAARPVPAAARQEKYRVFCVNGKVDFGNRTLKDMQWDFGKNVCQLSEHDSYRDAKEDVRRRGGVGAACACQ